MCSGSCLFLLFFDQLKIEAVQIQRNGDTHRNLGESFTETDSNSSKERTVSEGASLPAIRLLEVLAVRVKSLWDKLIWAVPDGRVFLNVA